MITSLVNAASSLWQLFSWRDGIELIGFLGISAVLIRWLQGNRRFLLEYTCCYFLLLTSVWYFHLSALFFVLSSLLPCGVLLLIVLYQREIQRALLCAPVAQSIFSNVWTNLLVKCSIHCFQYPINLIWMIEREFPLDEFLHGGIKLHAELSVSLLELIVHYYVQDGVVVLWIDVQGNLKRIQPEYSSHLVTHEQLAEFKHFSVWQQYALLMSVRCNACVVRTEPSTRFFTVVAGRKSYADLSSQSTLIFLKKLFYVTNVFQELECLNSASIVSDQASRASSGPAL